MKLNWLGLPLLQNLVGSSKTKEMVISGSNYSTKELESIIFLMNCMMRITKLKLLINGSRNLNRDPLWLHK